MILRQWGVRNYVYNVICKSCQLELCSQLMSKSTWGVRNYVYNVICKS